MNKVVHFEIPAKNLPMAQKFYSKAFGWKFNKWGKDYSVAIASKLDKKGRGKEAGAINGGIQKKGPRAKSVTIVLETKNIDDSLKKVKANGGKIAIPKEKMGDFGFYAQFDDTEGNRLGLFQSR